MPETCEGTDMTELDVGDIRNQTTTQEAHGDPALMFPA